jgi:tetratricopeptide (TPR) repeat protein
MAVEFATKACALSDWKSSIDLQALAAAYAEAGDFPNAVKWAEKAFELVPQRDRNEARERLQLYRDQKPFRITRIKEIPD